MDAVTQRLSIGMPVYNAERYIGFALDSILNQTFNDFEIIISDNASTDKTNEICCKYAKKDRRIKYHRNKINIGGPRNYNRVFKLASGEYFKWTAHDDVLAPEYLQKCVQVLDNDPSIVMCHSRVNRIDENGVLLDNYDKHTLFRISSFKPHERFADMISPRNTCWAIHSVIRSRSLALTHLHGDYIDADRNLLAEIALIGRIHEIKDHLFFRRDHPLAYTSTYYKNHTAQDYRKQLLWWTGERKERTIILPHWKNCLEYFNSINRVQLKPFERLSCYREVGNWLIREHGIDLMKMDLKDEFQFWRMKCVVS